MSKRKDGHPRGKYTLEFKPEAVRRVKGGQAAAVTARVLGIPRQTLENWVRLRGHEGQGAMRRGHERQALQLTLRRLSAQPARIEINTQFECVLLTEAV